VTEFCEHAGEVYSSKMSGNFLTKRVTANCVRNVLYHGVR